MEKENNGNRQCEEVTEEVVEDSEEVSVPRFRTIPDVRRFYHGPGKG